MDVSALQKEFRDKTLIVQHLVLLKKATSASSSLPLASSDDSAPAGYVLEELVGLTYTSEAFSAQLADFMCSRISAQSRKAASRLKTLRATRHVSRRGARAFRRRLRELDEALRAAAANADATKAKPAAEMTGTAAGESGGATTTEQEIRNVAKEIREYIFSEEVMRSDASDEPEVSPRDSATMTGMGSAGKTAGGKYEGFGSSGHAKETIGSRVADLLERTISPTDDRAEALRICMTSSTGDYQPVKVPAAVDMAASVKKKSFQASVLVEKEPTEKVKRHVPGRAGGGWESSDSDEERDEQLRRIEELAVRARSDDDQKDDDQKKSGAEAKEDPELRAVREFLNKPGPVAGSAGETKAVFQSISDANSLPALHLLSESLGDRLAASDSESGRSLRAMLLLEHFLRSDRVRAEVVDKCLGQLLADLAVNSNGDDGNAVKAKARKIRQTVLALLQANGS